MSALFLHFRKPMGKCLRPQPLPWLPPRAATPALCCSSTCKTSTTFFCLEQRNKEKHVKPSGVESKGENWCLMLTRGAGVFSEPCPGFPLGFGTSKLLWYTFTLAPKHYLNIAEVAQAFKCRCIPLHQPLSPGLTAHRHCQLAAAWQIVPGLRCETQHWCTSCPGETQPWQQKDESCLQFCCFLTGVKGLYHSHWPESAPPGAISHQTFLL